MPDQGLSSCRKVRLGGEVVTGEISASEEAEVVSSGEGSLPSWEPSVEEGLTDWSTVATLYFLTYWVSGKKKKIANALIPAIIPVNYTTALAGVPETRKLHGARHATVMVRGKGRDVPRNAISIRHR